MRGQAEQQRLAPSHDVGPRSDDQLADAEPGQQTGNGELSLRVGGAQLGGQLRERWEVGIDGQRPDRHQRTEHEH